VSKKRNPRTDKAVLEAVAALVEAEVADPRLRFVTFTEAQVTSDHEHALVFYSTLDPGLVTRDPRRTGGDRVPSPDEVAEGLASVAPRLQGLVSRRAKLRMTPQLTFEPDPVVEQASRVEDLLRRVQPTVPVPGAEPTGEYLAPREERDPIQTDPDDRTAPLRDDRTAPLRDEP
jgi:ribosome-binding factor A